MRTFDRIIFRPHSYLNTRGPFAGLRFLPQELDSTRVRRNIPSCHTSGMATPSIAARTHGIRTNEDALNTCGSGEQVCGTYQGSSAFECVNTDTALESCTCNFQYVYFCCLCAFCLGGGCIAPNPFISAEEQGLEGLDCTMIPHVRDVKCESGKCVVGGCDDGFRPSNDRETCIPSRLFA